jgi:hypothetical protein
MHVLYLNNGNNRRRNDRSLRDWHHNDKTDLRLYLLGTNRNSKKTQNSRLSNTYDSFIPSTIRQWNSLDPSLRNVDSIAKFKAELRKRKDISQVPK